MLTGWKTYIVAGLAALYSLAVQLGWLPNEPSVWGILNGAGLSALRLGIAKV
jgi:hypothetical protein